jgi:hypothetical protein
MSELSRANRNQYYTGGREADTLLTLVGKVWGLNKGTLLEPSVGSGAFPKASERLGLPYEWVTNELFPDNSNYRATHNEDFMAMPPFVVDAVVGNPPYTGDTSYKGVRMPLYLAFINKAFEFANRVAYVLPLPVLKWKALNMLPEGVEVVAWTTPKPNPYLLGGVGGGEVREVKTTIVLFERTGGPGVSYWNEAPEGLEWVAKGDERATHAVCEWGSVGEGRCLRGTWGRRVPTAERHCVITDQRIEGLVATDAMRRFIGELSSAVPSATVPEMNHYLNAMLRCEEVTC